MSDLKRFSRLGQVDFINTVNPNDSVVGARVNHEWCNTTTGTIWTCVDDTFGSQRWEGDNGQLVTTISDYSNPDLVLAYSMDSVSGGTLLDDSPNGRNATTNNVTYDVGIVGSTAVFTTSGSFAKISINSTVSIGSAASVCFWINVSSFPGANGYIILKSDDTYLFALPASSENKNTCSINGSSGISLGDTLVAGQWAFIVVNKNSASSFTVFCNANQGGTTGGSWTDFKYIGSKSNGGNASNSKVDQLRLFNRALTQAEITKLYNGGSGI